MADLTLKLVIRGPAAATKMSGLTAKLTITSNNNKSYTGDLTFTLTEVLSNETKPAKAQPGSITVPASGEFTNNYNIGKTGACGVGGCIHLRRGRRG